MTLRTGRCMTSRPTWVLRTTLPVPTMGARRSTDDRSASSLEIFLRLIGSLVGPLYGSRTPSGSGRRHVLDVALGAGDGGISPSLPTEPR